MWARMAKEERLTPESPRLIPDGGVLVVIAALALLVWRNILAILKKQRDLMENTIKKIQELLSLISLLSTDSASLMEDLSAERKLDRTGDFTITCSVCSSSIQISSLIYRDECPLGGQYTESKWVA
jgi:hypothetical protein